MVVFVLVQCYQCKTFMPQTQTKNNKWTCRMCNQKQSIVRVHGRSDQAKDLRLAAQQLNAKRGEEQEDEEEIKETVLGNVCEEERSTFKRQRPYDAGPISDDHGSRWRTFLDDRNDEDEKMSFPFVVDGDTDDQNEECFVMEIPKSESGRKEAYKVKNARKRKGRPQIPNLMDEKDQSDHHHAKVKHWEEEEKAEPFYPFTDKIQVTTGQDNNGHLWALEQTTVSIDDAEQQHYSTLSRAQEQMATNNKKGTVVANSRWAAFM